MPLSKRDTQSFDGAIISKAKFPKGSKPLGHVDPRLMRKREKKKEIISAISAYIEEDLIRINETLFRSKDNSRVVCTTSKKFNGSIPYYWYAYHPRWDEFLKDSLNGYLALGCLNLKVAFLIPRSEILNIIDYLNITSNKFRMYWHIQIIELQNGDYEIKLPRRDNINLKKYRLEL